MAHCIWWYSFLRRRLLACTKHLPAMPIHKLLTGSIATAPRWEQRLPVKFSECLREAIANNRMGDLHAISRVNCEQPLIEESMMQRAKRKTVAHDIRTARGVPADVGRIQCHRSIVQEQRERADTAPIAIRPQNRLPKAGIPASTQHGFAPGINSDRLENSVMQTRRKVRFKKGCRDPSSNARIGLQRFIYRLWKSTVNTLLPQDLLLCIAFACDRDT